jgi:hypothetical protein
VHSIFQTVHKCDNCEQLKKKDFRKKDYVYIYLGRSCAEVVDAGPGAERLLEPDGPADAVHQFVLA